MSTSLVFLAAAEIVCDLRGRNVNESVIGSNVEEGCCFGEVSLSIVGSKSAASCCDAIRVGLDVTG